MKIVDARVVVSSPGRNYVTLVIETEDGLVGVGDATLNGRELAVASYLRDHVCPLLVGRDARRIEDTWQYLYKGAYWRRGPVTMTSIAAVDIALWDIKGKLAGLPVYELLGGAAREGVMVYCHASGSTLDELGADFNAISTSATWRSEPRPPSRAWRRRTALRRPTARSTSRQAATCPRRTSGDQLLSGLCSPGDGLSPVGIRLRGAPATRRSPPADADRSRAAGRVAGAVPHVLDRGPYSRGGPVRVSADPPAHDTPIAVGEIFNSIWDCQQLITERLIDYIRTSVSHAGGITHLRRIFALADLYRSAPAPTVQATCPRSPWPPRCTST